MGCMERVCYIIFALLSIIGMGLVMYAFTWIPDDSAFNFPLPLRFLTALIVGVLLMSGCFFCIRIAYTRERARRRNVQHLDYATVPGRLAAMHYDAESRARYNTRNDRVVF